MATTSSPRPDWAALAEVRPALDGALYVAQHLRRRSPGFCANHAWFAVLKPTIVNNVGRGASLTCPGFHFQTLADALAERPIEHTPECQAAWQAQRWLQTSEAYDVAYDMVYAALPNCQHGDRLCR